LWLKPFGSRASASQPPSPQPSAVGIVSAMALDDAGGGKWDIDLSRRYTLNWGGMSLVCLCTGPGVKINTDQQEMRFSRELPQASPDDVKAKLRSDDAPVRCQAGQEPDAEPDVQLSPDGDRLATIVQPPSSGPPERPEEILAAWGAGRAAEARRGLLRLEEAQRIDGSPPGGLDADVARRIRHVGSMFESSAVELRSLGKGKVANWTTETVDGLEFSFKIGNGSVQLVSTAEYEGCESLRALAAMLEVDLCKGYKPNVQGAEPLGKQVAADCFWRIHQRGYFNKKKEDSIVRVSFVDALDEPLGSLWACVCVIGPADLAKACPGLEAPPLEKGSMRIDSGQTTCRITPVKKLGPSGLPGIRMTMKMDARCPDAVAAMPGMLLRPLMKRVAKEFVGNMKKHIQSCRALDERLLSSPRAELYAEVREHLAGRRSKPRSAPALAVTRIENPTEAAARDALNVLDLSVSKSPSREDLLASERSFCRVQDAVPRERSDKPTPVQEFDVSAAISWVELSQQLPIDWADLLP